MTDRPSTWGDIIAELEAGVAREMAKHPGPPPDCECAALQAKREAPVMCRTCEAALRARGYVFGPGV